MSSSPPDPVIAVIHGVAARREESCREEVELLASYLDLRATFVPIYWGDIARADDHVETVVPYPNWATAGAAAASVPDHGEASSSLRQAFRARDLEAILDDMAAGWRRRSSASRHRILAGVYSLLRDQYLKASAQFTGDLIYYHRHREQLWGRVWEVLMREAPGAGLPERPLSVIGHSLGATVAFDMAMEAEPRLHIDRLFTCATQTPFFHAIGCSPPAIDPTSSGEPVQLPDGIGSWMNFFVALDPWAYVAAPVFTLSNGTRPEDIEVHAGTHDDRIVTHLARHYFRHPIVISRIREGFSGPSAHP